MLKIEQVQKAVVKVPTFRPCRFSIKDLYEYCKVLTVRQQFVHQTVLRQPNIAHNNVFLTHGRVNVISRTVICKSSFSQKVFYVLGRFICNKTNNMSAINQKTKESCTHTLHTRTQQTHKQLPHFNSCGDFNVC